MVSSGNCKEFGITIQSNVCGGAWFGEISQNEAERAGKNKILEKLALHTMKFRFY